MFEGIAANSWCSRSGVLQAKLGMKPTPTHKGMCTMYDIT